MRIIKKLLCKHNMEIIDLIGTKFRDKEKKEPYCYLYKMKCAICGATGNYAWWQNLIKK